MLTTYEMKPIAVHICGQMLCYASGNRDEAVFDAPFTFRPDRPAAKSIAFGYGAHLCLGQHLARLELQIFMEELLPRLQAIELTAPVEMVASAFVNGPRHVPLRYTFAHRGSAARA